MPASIMPGRIITDWRAGVWRPLWVQDGFRPPAIRHNLPGRVRRTTRLSATRTAPAAGAHIGLSQGA